MSRKAGHHDRRNVALLSLFVRSNQGWCGTSESARIVKAATSRRAVKSGSIASTLDGPHLSREATGK
jgi:hypothetical protein